MDVEYLYFHTRMALSTTERAAEERVRHDPTTSTTSLFERTSQIFQDGKERKKVSKMIALFIMKTSELAENWRRSEQPHLLPRQ